MGRKLCSRRGTTLSEMLVAVAVLGLVALAVAVGTNSAMRVYRQSVSISDAQTLTSTLTQALADELRYARDVRTEGGALTYTSANYGAGVSIGQSDSGQLTVGGGALVGSGSYAGLRAEAQVTYDESLGCFQVALTVTDGAGLTQTTAFTVRRLNTA